MLTVLKPDTLRASQLALIAAVGAVTRGRRMSSYVRTLNALQPNQLPVPDAQVTPVLDFAIEGPGLQAFLKEISNAEEVHAFSEAERQEISAKVQAGLARLRSFNPAAEDAVRCLISRLVFARHARRGGGSAANTVGVVWLSPPPGASADDFAEFLLHEATHQALFLADMIQPLFTVERRLGNMPQITSAIRRQRRDYDLAFHAACVAASLIELHEALGNEHRVQELRQGLSLTMSELMVMTEPLTESGRAILLELDAIDRAPRFQSASAPGANPAPEPALAEAS